MNCKVRQWNLRIVRDQLQSEGVTCLIARDGAVYDLNFDSLASRMWN
jgi:hypothetical protein